MTTLDLLTLSEQCTILEDRIYAMLDRLSTKEQEIVKDYINTRNDLEWEARNAALGNAAPQITPRNTTDITLF